MVFTANRVIINRLRDVYIYIFYIYIYSILVYHLEFLFLPKGSTVRTVYIYIHIFIYTHVYIYIHISISKSFRLLSFPWFLWNSDIYPSFGSTKLDVFQSQTACFLWKNQPVPFRRTMEIVTPIKNDLYVWDVGVLRWSQAISWAQVL